MRFRWKIIKRKMKESEKRTPDYMLLSKLKFQLSLPENRNDETMKAAVLDLVTRNNMTKCYDDLCQEFQWDVDHALRQEMRNANAAAWDDLRGTRGDSRMEDEGSNWRDKLEYACTTGDMDNAADIARTIAEDENCSGNDRTEALFYLFRIALFLRSISRMRRILRELTKLLSTAYVSAGDWYFRNKLKVYEAIYCLARRKFRRTSELLLDCIATFESYELLPFTNILQYTIIASAIALTRSELNERLNNCGILTQELTLKCPRYYEYFRSLYDCNYAAFFHHLRWLKGEMKSDPLLHFHYKYYQWEMRARSYSQFLRSYRVLSLKQIAEEFGSMESHVERDIVRFILDGKFPYKIDAISKSVVTIRSVKCESTSVAIAIYDRPLIYQNIVRNGDALLNHLKRLVEVMDF